MKSILFVILTVIFRVTFLTNVDCPKCEKKVMENISFEKGVKDLSVDIKKHTVSVTYDSAKTDTVKLAKALNKLGYSARVSEFNKVK